MLFEHLLFQKRLHLLKAKTKSIIFFLKGSIWQIDNFKHSQPFSIKHWFEAQGRPHKGEMQIMHPYVLGW